MTMTGLLLTFAGVVSNASGIPSLALTPGLDAVEAADVTAAASARPLRSESLPQGSFRVAQAGAKLSSEQQANLSKLKTDLQATRSGSQVTTESKQAVKNDIAKIMSSGATRPSSTSVQKLAGDLSASLADKTLTADEVYSITEDVAEVIASGNVSQADAQKLVADVEALLKATGVDGTQLQTLKADVQAIVTAAPKPKK